ncbi:MAG TPA: hypothetical protein VFJ24_03980 [Gaiellales bacterium]|nr:hypothetical protein [Gaiellales bacterium]
MATVAHPGMQEPMLVLAPGGQVFTVVQSSTEEPGAERTDQIGVSIASGGVGNIGRSAF